METRSYAKSWDGMILVHAVPGGYFKRCCMKSQKYDGELRNYYFRD